MNKIMLGFRVRGKRPAGRPGSLASRPCCEVKVGTQQSFFWGRRALVGAFLIGLLSAASWGSDPTSALSFVVLKDDNGKPVRNAAVVLHPVNSKGKQGRGGFELKTDSEGKTQFEGVPYGKLRVQVLAPGFQTYGEDFDIAEPAKEITVRLKRPQKQYSIYDDAQGTPKKDTPPEKKQ